MRKLLWIGLGLVCGILSGCRGVGQSFIPRAKGGIIDLRQVDLRRTSVPLDGEWILYWNKLLGPGDPLPTSGQPVNFPALWRHTIINGHRLPDQGYATYALTILLPKHTDSLALQLYNTYTSLRVFVNNLEVASAGHPGTTDNATVKIC